MCKEIRWQDVGVKTEKLDGIDVLQETVTLKAIVDPTPYRIILDKALPILEKHGIKINFVADASDSTTNEKTNTGEIDFSFFQHEPYPLDQNIVNGFKLASAGGIHVEPISAYSDKYTAKESSTQINT